MARLRKVLSALVPGEHALGTVEPTPHECPSGQAVQLACASSPVSLPYEPSAHGAALALTLPASQ